MANVQKSQFVAALATSKTLGKSLKAMKEVKSDGRSSVPAGQYIAKLVKASAYVKDNKPRVTLRFVVDRGEHKGASLPAINRYLCAERSSWGERTEAENFERLSKDLQSCGCDMSEVSDASDLELLLAALEKEKPTIAVQVNAPRTPGGWPSMYLNGPVDDETPSEDEPFGDDPEDEESEDAEDSGEEETEDADDENTEDEDSEGEDSDDEESEEEEEPEVQIVRKDQVFFTPKGAKKRVKCSVTASNASKRTCDLVEIATKKPHKGISWDTVSTIGD